MYLYFQIYFKSPPTKVPPLLGSRDGERSGLWATGKKRRLLWVAGMEHMSQLFKCRHELILSAGKTATKRGNSVAGRVFVPSSPAWKRVRIWNQSLKQKTSWNVLSCRGNLMKVSESIMWCIQHCRWFGHACQHIQRPPLTYRPAPVTASKIRIHIFIKIHLS